MISAKHRSFVLVIIFCSLLTLPLKGNDFESSSRQFGFAESLFAEREYFRAITEYKRFLFHYPQNKLLCEKSAFRIGECYFKAGRWKETVSEFSRFIDNYPQSALHDAGQYFIGLSQIQLKRYDDALSTLNGLTKDVSSHYYEKAYYHIGMIGIEERQWQAAKDAFSKISKDSALFPSSDTISAGLDHAHEIPQKEPLIAGALAAVLPGAGHLYAERPKDAVVSLLLNGSFIWAAAELFDHKHYGAAAIFAFFELGWYGGNIYSAVNSAHKYNEKAQDKFIENLKESSRLSYYFEPVSRASYVTLSIKF
ncbi:MAG: tetratricopeptide repeat protein [Syntrophaceae bacterium]|nr:tetratricopeptide repeat protein [Syntrophaceae bacterium]